MVSYFKDIAKAVLEPTPLHVLRETIKGYRSARFPFSCLIISAFLSQLIIALLGKVTGIDQVGHPAFHTYNTVLYSILGITIVIALAFIINLALLRMAEKDLERQDAKNLTEQ